MDAKTLEALRGSIAKWERNAEAKTPGEYLIDDSDCPLCCLFLCEDCRGCPVLERTGRGLCNGTPYRPAAAAWAHWSRSEISTERQALAHAAARDEVAFLKSLLPEETP